MQQCPKCRRFNVECARLGRTYQWQCPWRDCSGRFTEEEIMRFNLLALMEDVMECGGVF